MQLTNFLLVHFITSYYYYSPASSTPSSSSLSSTHTSSSSLPMQFRRTITIQSLKLLKGQPLLYLTILLLFLLILPLLLLLLLHHCIAFTDAKINIFIYIPPWQYNNPNFNNKSLLLSIHLNVCGKCSSWSV